MRKTIIRAAAVLALYVAAQTGVHAATCSYRPYEQSAGERSMERYFVGRMCTQSTVSRYWRDFGFRKRYWDDGFGFHDVCNWRKPLGRMMGALYLLENSHSPRASSLGDWSGPLVKSAYPYSGTVYDDLDDLRGRCHHDNSNDSILAATYRGFFVDDRIQFYFNSIYGQSAVARASTILHEGHHYGGKVSHSCGASRDRNYSDWRPYASQTAYLISYYQSANAHTNDTWKDYAADQADARIANKFCNPVPAWVRNFR